MRPWGCVAISILCVASGSAFAQDGPSMTVGRIESAKNCTLYQQSAGRVGVVATRRAVGMYATWRTWLERDCVDNFAGIRTALEAALAAAGGTRVRTGGARYTIGGRISDVSGDDGPMPLAPAPGADGYAVASRGMRVVMDVTVRDAAGRIVFGAPIVKTIETGYDVRADDFRATGGEDGRSAYARLQQEVALAVARAVSFHFTPLEVTAIEDRQVRLNYGAPLLKLGTIVQVTSRDGFAVLRFAVTSADNGGAVARLDGGGDPGRLRAGDRAVAIESDDPAANARRFEKVDLP